MKYLFIISGKNEVISDERIAWAHKKKTEVVILTDDAIGLVQTQTDRQADRQRDRQREPKPLFFCKKNSFLTNFRCKLLFHALTSPINLHLLLLHKI